MKTIAIMGLGNRGGVYADGFAKNNKVKIEAVCDPSAQSLLRGKEQYGVAENMLFADENEFFAKKRADILVVSTMDELHCNQTVRALEMGYDVLLEKPVSPNYEECKKIAECAARTGRSVVVCHNLRYAPFYQKIKTIIVERGIGDVVHVEQSENVGFGHYMCSFVRGKWHDSNKTSPIILQKCCHDLDIIYWVIGRKCERLSSVGSLSYYNSAHAQGKPTHCIDCKEIDCPYDARDFYLKSPESLCVPYGFDKSKENILRYVADKSHDYGRCVFRSDNNVCDRQTVNMLFEGGVTANLFMHGFANRTDRITAIYGTEGVVRGAFDSGIVELERFDGHAVSFDVKKEIQNESHNGGDAKLVDDFVDYMVDGKRALGISLVEDSMYSHKLAFAAEQSRLNGGEWVRPGGTL